MLTTLIAVQATGLVNPGSDRDNARYFTDRPECKSGRRQRSARQLRGKAAEQGYDPNIWFENVDVITAKDIGRETVQYVSNILKYYVGYRLSVEQQVSRAEERKKRNID